MQHGAARVLGVADGDDAVRGGEAGGNLHAVATLPYVESATWRIKGGNPFLVAPGTDFTYTLSVHPD